MSLEYTLVSEIPQHVEELRHNVRGGGGKLESVQFRLNQLRDVFFAMEDNIDLFCDALYDDFHKSKFETRVMEYYVARLELVHLMLNLSKWLKPESAYSVPLVHLASGFKIEKIPLGVVLIISPFNYPLLLSISPIVGAIAAGNAVVFKPSELTPNFSALLTEVLTKLLDPDVFRVVNGGVSETTALLQQKFDLIFFTGSQKVGKIVARSAADHLTPSVLELGGKSPAVVTKNHGNLETVLRRILWGKCSNAGQTCVAVDYILCDAEVKPQLISLLKKILEEEFFANGFDDYSHISGKPSYDNLKKILGLTRGKVISGSSKNVDHVDDSLMIPPTIIDDVDWDDSTMQGELFGPILPILTFNDREGNDLESCLNNVIDRNLDCPLLLYAYTTNEREVQLIKTKIKSGAYVVNDDLTHVGVGTLPFGGVGNSGYGSYHGKYSIETFSHRRTIMRQPYYAEILLKLRYPPFTPLKLKLLGLSLDGRAYFRRTGDVPINRYQTLILQLLGLLLLTTSLVWLYLWLY